MTHPITTISNPDLTVGDGNKQRWNQPAHRRHGFHNAHLMFRRTLSLRSARQLVLKTELNSKLANLPATKLLTARPEISALVCVQGDRILLSHHADDFKTNQPHSIQSISKLFIHLIAGRLIAEGRLDTSMPVEHYLHDIGSGYRGALIQDVLDMNLRNNFSEDYTDPNASCFDEEIALGWRLPPQGTDDTTLLNWVKSITGTDLTNHAPTINYSSANTDVLTVICDRLTPEGLPRAIEGIVAAAGLEHALHVSLSSDGLPTLSGGGCMSATDLARFGLLLARQISVDPAQQFSTADFTHRSLERPAKTLPPPRDHVRYSNHLMTNGRWLGHAGYGGQFLMVDMQSGTACAFLSVLENDAGYCLDYMAETINCLDQITMAAAELA